MSEAPALLALADGTVFRGRAFGARGEAVGELVFNTSMTGYQEILTDPSYEGQLVAMTYPEIGNVGVNREDVESRRPYVRGFVVREVTCAEPYDWTQGPWRLGRGYTTAEEAAAERRGHEPCRVVAYDFGIKYNILRNLVGAGCRVRVVPATTSAAETLALGGRTYKLKFGHHGGNQPVRDLATGKVEITAQNHGFAVDIESLRGRAEVTHLNLNDRTVEGLEVTGQPTFSIQYHPEASPGPHDARYLFRRFVELMARTAE